MIGKKKGFFSQPDGLQLGEVAEIEAQNFDLRTIVELSTKPVILQNSYYAQFLCLCKHFHLSIIYRCHLVYKIIPEI